MKFKFCPPVDEIFLIRLTDGRNTLISSDGSRLMSLFFVEYDALHRGVDVIVEFDRESVTPRPTDSTGELENLSDESEELFYSSFFPDLCNTYLEFFSLP